MAYYIDLFSPETHAAFSSSDQKVSGFRERHKNIAAAIHPGDKLICYMTKLSRWVGVLEVMGPFFVDDTPLFTYPTDPFTIRFQVKPAVWLPPEQAIPMAQDICWKHLSFTRDLPKSSSAWTGMVRGSLRRLSDEDGRYLETLLVAQLQAPHVYLLSPGDKKNLQPSVVNSAQGQIVVSVPDNGENRVQGRENDHIRMQASLAEIGERMGMKIWLPRSDRQQVLTLWNPDSGAALLERLPLNYDGVTLQTIENIDVLWIRRHSIVRAFEVEHSTSIYSGLLRMADLMALQPNLSIRAHIVAPARRRSKVLREMVRPVFSLMESGPMSEFCSYLSYEAVTSLLGERNLSHLNDSVLEEYVEYAQDADFL